MARYRKSVISSILAVLFFSLPAIAASPQDAVRRLVGQFSSGKSEPGIARAVNSNIDFDSIVSQSFQPSQWSSFSQPQQKQLVSSFTELIQARYYMRWHKIFQNAKLSFGDVAHTAKGTFVRSYLKHGSEQDTVTWMLNPSNQVSDLTVNGKDLIQRLNETAEPQLQKRGPTKFIAWMKDEAATAQKRAGEAAANANGREAM